MACFMTTQEHRDLRVLSFIILHSQHYIMLVIRRYSPLTLLFTCLQWWATIKEIYKWA